MASSCSEFESSELPDIGSSDNDDDDETDIAFSSEPLASLPPPFPNLPPPSSTSSASSRTLSSLQVNKTCTTLDLALWEEVKYYFADFVRKGGTLPPPLRTFPRKIFFKKG